MASRRLALIGAGAGPWVDISRVPRPHLRIAGKLEGEVLVEVRGEKDETLVFADTGEFPLKPASWLRACVSKRNSKVICEVVSGGRA